MAMRRRLASISAQDETGPRQLPIPAQGGALFGLMPAVCRRAKGPYGTRIAAEPPPARRFSRRALPVRAAIGIRLRGMTHHDASDRRSDPAARRIRTGPLPVAIPSYRQRERHGFAPDRLPECSC
jgi:hypothetical protein